MSSILSIATSGLLAAQTRPQVSFSNVANPISGGPSPAGSAATQPQYPPANVSQQVSQVPAAGGSQTGSNPTAPRANGGGQLASPNIELTNELLQQQIAQIEFASNEQVAQVYSQNGGQLVSPNVDLTNELLQQQIAQIEFASDVQVAQVYSQIAQNLVNITA